LIVALSSADHMARAAQLQFEGWATSRCPGPRRLLRKAGNSWQWRENEWRKLGMDMRINRIAMLANVSAYGSEAARTYVDGAPHLKHASLRKLYGELVVEIFDKIKANVRTPMVLDLGAGEGSATMSFLELGAKVLAVDISQGQLDALRARSRQFGEMLEIRCQDVNDMLCEKHTQFDIVVLNSFLHHIPDYLGLIREAVTLLNPGGQFFSFQDPLRFDSLGSANRLFGTFAYISWRIFKGDVLGALNRHIRRLRGIYLTDSVHDNAEYHMTRNGVDQDAIRGLFAELNFACRIVSYFSTQSRLFQPIGSAFAANNTFAVIAQAPVKS
jgi:2-polyprenyl-3-methyl-5-hydroxy-6-metoxy-1,4-benzoquinol methylase